MKNVRDILVSAPPRGNTTDGARLNKNYVLASWIGTLPGTLLYVYLGAAGKAGLSAAAGQSSGRSAWEYLLFSLGLVATVVVTVWVRRIARRELSKSEVEVDEAATETSL